MSSPQIKEIQVKGSYCSLSHAPSLPIHTIREGVDRIMAILAKDLICSHDVEDLNLAYREVDALEKVEAYDRAIAYERGNVIDQPTQILNRGSKYVLDQIIRKVENIYGKNKALNSKDLITLYHLKRFSDKELPIQPVFDKLLPVAQGVVASHDIARDLPLCVSDTDFNEDVSCLIGSSVNKEADIFLKEKKAAYEQAKRKKEEIERKKREFALLHEKDAERYPVYLDRVLDLGHTHLYDHIVQMKNLRNREERKSFLRERMGFSELCHVILEIKEVIVQQVRSSIPKSCRGVVFLLGGSGAGKSTSLCFLRGDEILLRSDFRYESKNDQGSSIGHGLPSSHTFFPNVEIVNELAIVDFPGFEDTNGPIVSLGIECALRVLIQECSPKILVFEAITNIEGKFTAASHLANRLQRILKNKKNCFLGITKYSFDPNYRKIKSIEEEQERQRKSPSTEELSLRAQIQLLSQLIPEVSTQEVTTLQAQKQQKEKELEQLEQQRLVRLERPQPEIEECRKAIALVEGEMLKQTGLGQIIRFADLRDQVSLMDTLAFLTEPPREETSLNIRLEFDAEDKRLLDERFEQLMQQLNEKSYGEVEWKDFNVLKRRVMGASLISTITQDFPEIGKFLHSPEVTPNLAREYDKKIVGAFLQKYMEEVISGLNVSVVKKMLNHYRSTIGEELFAKTTQNLIDLRQYVTGLLGRSLSSNESKAEEEWEALQNQYASFKKTTKEGLDLPGWAKVCLSLPVGIPYGIYYLWRRYQESQVLEAEIKGNVEKYNILIGRIRDTLEQLKRLERIIERRVSIDEAFHSMPISINSLDTVNQSVKSKIAKVRSLYGEEEWDARVVDLLNRFFPGDLFVLGKKNSEQLDCISHHIVYIVASLLDPEIEWLMTTTEKGSKTSSVTTYLWESLGPKHFVGTEDPSIFDSLGSTPSLSQKSQEEPIQSSQIQKAQEDVEAKSVSRDSRNIMYSYTIRTDLRRRNTKEVCALGVNNSIRLLPKAWNLNILPHIQAMIEIKTPLTLALLGAILLKKWDSKEKKDT